MNSRFFLLSMIIPLVSGCSFGFDTPESPMSVATSGEITSLSGNEAPLIEAKKYIPPMTSEEILSLEKDPDSMNCDTINGEKKEFCHALKTGQEYSRMMQSTVVTFDCTTLIYTANKKACTERNTLREMSSRFQKAAVENSLELCASFEQKQERDACMMQVILHPIIINEQYKTASGRELLKQEGIFQENFEPIAERSCDALRDAPLVEQCLLDVQKIKTYFASGTEI